MISMPAQLLRRLLAAVIALGALALLPASAAHALQFTGNLFVGNYLDGTIARIDPLGNTTVFATGLSSPEGLAFDALGNLYVAENGTGEITRIDPSGMQTTFLPGGTLLSPFGLAFDAAGNLYAADGAAGTILRFPNVAGVLSPVGTVYGTGLAGPAALAFDGAGNLFVSEIAGQDILKFTAALTSTVFASGFDFANGLAFGSGGNLYVSEANADAIRILSPGGVESDFVTTGLDSPNGIAFDINGNLYVAENFLDKVTRLNPGGGASTFGLVAANGNPVGLAFDGSPTAVPEPGTLGLLGVGLAAWLRRARSRAVVSRSSRRAILALALLLAGLLPSAAHAGLKAGFAKRDVTPNPTVAPPSGNVNLGGFGLGCGPLGCRLSTGVLDPVMARAMVIGNGTVAAAFVEIDNQGMFTAYKPETGMKGLLDIRKDAVAGCPQLAINRILINTDHSHAGPDLIGAWGGVPASYANYIHDQAVAAIVEACNNMVDADLYVGTVTTLPLSDPTRLLNSQFDVPPNDQVDLDLRVIRAFNHATGQPLGTFINFAAHATVMGSGNTKISPDWPAPVNNNAEAELGGISVTMVADVGRTQPNRGLPSSNPNCNLIVNGDARGNCHYGRRVSDVVNLAAANAVPIQGTTIAGNRRFFFDNAENGGLLGLLLIGQAITVPIARSQIPPFLQGTALGTEASAVRVGDTLFACMPGEGYPFIQFTLEDQVNANHHFSFGLCNDQLGYLISPIDGYPYVASQSADNDNALFNVSPEIGDHVTCLILKAARQLGFQAGPGVIGTQHPPGTTDCNIPIPELPAGTLPCSGTPGDLSCS